MNRLTDKQLSIYPQETQKRVRIKKRITTLLWILAPIIFIVAIMQNDSNPYMPAIGYCVAVVLFAVGLILSREEMRLAKTHQETAQKHIDEELASTERELGKKHLTNAQIDEIVKYIKNKDYRHNLQCTCNACGGKLVVDNGFTYKTNEIQQKAVKGVYVTKNSWSNEVEQAYTYEREERVFPAVCIGCTECGYKIFIAETESWTEYTHECQKRTYFAFVESELTTTAKKNFRKKLDDAFGSINETFPSFFRSKK